MGDVSILEILVILVVALLAFGPGRLPEFARGLGKAVHEFRRATDRIQSELQLDPVQPVDIERLDEGKPRTLGTSTHEHIVVQPGAEEAKAGSGADSREVEASGSGSNS